MSERRLILAVSVGPLRGRKAAVRPEASLIVGRSEQLSGFALPKDAQLSTKHFELQWDGARARVRDLDSIGGTRLNGEKIAEADVPHGAWIRAGETNFTVHIEAHTPPPEDDRSDEDAESEASKSKSGEEGEATAAAKRAEDGEPPFPAEEPEPENDALYDTDEDEQWDALQAARQARKERAFRREAVARALPILAATAQRETLHAILDAARSDRILEVLRESVEEHRSLYEGVQGETLDDVAPYLVRLGPGSRLLEQLVREGWTRRWGIFAEGAVLEKDMRRHLRRFLMVEDAKTREPLYFRFYDPGVLRDFWPTCSRRQLGELMGPLRAFLVEGARGEVLRLTADGKVEPWFGPG